MLGLRSAGLARAEGRLSAGEIGIQRTHPRNVVNVSDSDVFLNILMISAQYLKDLVNESFRNSLISN